MPREIVFKTVVMGEGSVGKTSMVMQYCEKRFSESYIMTIGSNFMVKILPIPEKDLIVRLQIWDLAGQVAFSFVRPGFYRGSSGGIYAFDITNRSTFEKIKDWLVESKQYLGVIPYILVGNKLDLRDERVVSHREGEQLAKEIGASGYFETSAKTSENLDFLFHKLIEDMLMKTLNIKLDSILDTKN